MIDNELIYNVDLPNNSTESIENAIINNIYLWIENISDLKNVQFL